MILNSFHTLEHVSVKITVTRMHSYKVTLVDYSNGSRYLVLVSWTITSSTLRDYLALDAKTL